MLKGNFIIDRSWSSEKLFIMQKYTDNANGDVPLTENVWYFLFPLCQSCSERYLHSTCFVPSRNYLSINLWCLASCLCLYSSSSFYGFFLMIFDGVFENLEIRKQLLCFRTLCLLNNLLPALFWEGKLNPPSVRHLVKWFKVQPYNL